MTVIIGLAVPVAVVAANGGQAHPVTRFAQR